MSVAWPSGKEKEKSNASIRILVGLANERVNNYRILQGVIPISLHAQ